MTHPPKDTGIGAAILSVAINLLLAVIKGTVGFFGNSYALIADATESLADVFTSAVVVMGIRYSLKAPDENHPYGHGKAEPVVTIIVSVGLLISAALIAIGGVNRIMVPRKGPSVIAAIVIILVIVVKELLFRYEHKKGRELNSTAIKADAWHHRSDVMTSLTVLIGISIAIIGGKNYVTADAWAALVASLIITYNSFKIFYPAFNEIMDVAPSVTIVQDVKSVALTVDGVIKLDKCFVRKMGRFYYVDLHVMVNKNLTVEAGHDISHRVKDKILAAGINVSDVLIHIEPV